MSTSRKQGASARPAIPADITSIVFMLEREVRLMREHQRAFFGGDRSPQRIQTSKGHEREVDRLLAAIDRLRNPPPPPAQGGLFGTT